MTSFIQIGCNDCTHMQEAEVLRETDLGNGEAEYLTGSGAHYCNECDSSNVTWLGIIEKLEV